MTAQVTTAVLLVGLAAAHSLAGESGFIRPLVAAEWTIAEAPRWAANRMLRIAWHLTSVAWLALAVIVIGGTPGAAIAAASLVSGSLIFVGLRAHPAWPAFVLAGLFGLEVEGLLVRPLLVVGAGLAVAIALAAAALHLYWVAGGQVLLDDAVPVATDGSPALRPGRAVTLAVAVLLVTFAGLIVVVAVTDEAWFVRSALLIGVGVLAIRAVGDGRSAGFFKRHRHSRFAELDDQWFTPLVTILALAAPAAVLL